MSLNKKDLDRYFPNKHIWRRQTNKDKARNKGKQRNKYKAKDCTTKKAKDICKDIWNIWATSTHSHICAYMWASISIYHSVQCLTHMHTYIGTSIYDMCEAEWYWLKLILYMRLIWIIYAYTCMHWYLAWPKGQARAWLCQALIVDCWLILIVDWWYVWLIDYELYMHTHVCIDI